MDELVQKLKCRLQKEKVKKQKLKRKLKLKLAQKELKFKAKLERQKKKVRKLTASGKSKNEKNLSEQLSANEQIVENICIPMSSGFSSNDEMTERDCQPDDEMTTERDVDRFDIQYIHSYAKCYGEKCSKMYYFCSDCKFKTTKKSNLMQHKNAVHQQESLQKMQCPVCEKQFTYDGLRGHLRHFSTGSHDAKNQHAKYTPLEHKMMLEKLKEHKNK